MRIFIALQTNRAFMMLYPPASPSAIAPNALAVGQSIGRLGRALIIAAAGSVSVSTGAVDAAAGLLHIRCTNPASGASWPLVVDLDHSRVDSLAATITDKWISWHDPNQGFFDLERATGKLQLRNASSTGGYFLHFLCRSG